MIRFFRGAVLGLLVAVCSVAALAETDSALGPSFAFYGPYQFTSSGGAHVLLDELYERNDYERVGVILDFLVDSFSYPDNGDTWIVSVEDVETGQRLGQIAIYYDGAQDCLVHNGSQLICQIVSRIENFHIYNFSIDLFFEAQCVDTKGYRLVAEQQLRDKPLEENRVSPMAFTPTRFRPDLDEELFFFPQNIMPALYKGGEGQKGYLGVYLLDDIGCNKTVEDAEVTMTSTVLPQSNHQTYLAEGAFGTGKFISVGFEAEVKEDEPYFGTRVVGKSDESGVFQAVYQAQRLATKEEVEVKAKLEATDKEPEYNSEPVKKELTISIPDLFPLTTAFRVGFVDGGSCPQDNMPKQPYYFGKYPHWMAPIALVKFSAVADQYYYTTGRYLSVNDASLKLGGAIANNAQSGRDANCHKSHRFGIDIDLNQTDRNAENTAQDGLNMFSTEIYYKGRPQPVVDMLTHLMERQGAEKILEEPIHYRFHGGGLQ